MELLIAIPVTYCVNCNFVKEDCYCDWSDYE